MTDMPSLDELGVLESTDKSSLRHDYLRHYEEFFASLRDADINVIEIGALGGKSLRMWRNYFTRATIIGVDILESCRRHAGDRIMIEIGSQDDPEFLARVASKWPPTIVIDDGSHYSPHMLVSFETLFPKLMPGGWYVVEDLDMFGGRTEVAQSPHEMLAEIGQALIVGGSRLRTRPAGRTAKDVDRIDFVDGATFIRKSDPAARLTALAAREELAKTAGHSDNWFFLSETLLRIGAALDRAEMAARKAVAMRPADERYNWQLAAALEAKGQIGDAIIIATRMDEKCSQEGKCLSKRFQVQFERLKAKAIKQAITP